MQTCIAFYTAGQGVVIVRRLNIQIVTLSGIGEATAHLARYAVAAHDQVAERWQGRHRRYPVSIARSRAAGDTWLSLIHI